MVSTTHNVANSRRVGAQIQLVAISLIGCLSGCGGAATRPTPPSEVPAEREAPKTPDSVKTPQEVDLRRAAEVINPGRRGPEVVLPGQASGLALAVPGLDADRCPMSRLAARLETVCAPPRSVVSECARGLGHSCTDLGDCHAIRWRRPGHAAQSATLYAAGCEGGSARGCLQKGRLLVRGGAVARDFNAALHSFDRACKGGNAQGCAAAGTLRYLGKGGPRDRDKAAHLFDRACKGGAGLGCMRLGVMYGRGEPRAHIGRNGQRALALYERGCQLCDGDACLLAARRLADDPAGSARAAAWRAEACRLGVAEACSKAP